MECTIRSILKDGNRVSGCFGYQRESGRFVVFKTKAVVLATGGIGRCWEITSNSWEYTADGHAMAMWAGADLIDMEFIQFHPTGMVWPPSVRGTLITEGVRGEGGVLLNGKRERFMFDYVPDMFKGEFAETEDEANKWIASTIAGERPTARRPPELLTRDVVARAIRREIREGRGSPHGGVFLDIATRRKAEDIKKKLPSMYHQFKELADVDITTDPMEVGPTCHYMMGGVRVNDETQESTVPGLYAAGEVGGGMHGANRLGGNSLSDLLVFGKRAGEFAAKKAKETSQGKINQDDIEREAAEALKCFGDGQAENPYAIHEDLRAVMQSLVGIVRTDEDLRSGARENRRAARACGEGQGWRQHSVQSGLAPDARFEEHARYQRGGHQGGARADRKPRRAHARGFPRDGQGMGEAELHRAAEQGRHRCEARAAAGDAGGVGRIAQEGLTDHGYEFLNRTEERTEEFE